MQNTIERSITISAPLERVWDLVTEPGWWVPSEAPASGDRTPGAVVVRESEKYGRFPVEVAEMKPMTYAAFRWASAFPGDDLTPERSTLIEFTVKPADDGRVLVSVVESGFATIDAPDEVKNQSVESNSDGWTQELELLRTRSEA
jgi:uncharacterized protein YndB with AHSA1/START domain